MKIGKGINWFLILLCSLIPVVLISSLFFFNHKKQDAEVVNTPTTEQRSTTSTTTTSSPSTSSTTSQDSITTTTEEERPSTQEEKTNAKSQKIDEQAILNGDFSTLVGTWRNGLGQEFTFDKNGLVNSGNIEKASIGNDGSINFSVRTGNTGFGMIIYPAGTTMKWVDSDPSKNRLIAGQAAPTSSEQVFYRVD